MTNEAFHPFISKMSPKLSSTSLAFLEFLFFFLFFLLYFINHLLFILWTLNYKYSLLFYYFNLRHATAHFYKFWSIYLMFQKKFFISVIVSNFKISSNCKFKLIKTWITSFSEILIFKLSILAYIFLMSV